MEKPVNIYFASDFHLGSPNREKSLVREKKVVKWLDEVSQDADEIFLVGDLFDFWFEYKKAVPRGFTRLLGKISELTDRGIPIHVFTGNHDMWIFDYLPQETGVMLYRDNIERSWNGKKFLIGHGDGLGPGDHGYKFIKKVFASKVCQWLFARLHPNLGISMADFWSRKSRSASEVQDSVFLGEDQEWLAIYCKEILEKQHFDYFVFGHRHLPLDLKVGPDSRYINLGDWISHFTYGHFDGSTMHLKTYTD
ncbi:MAG: UDP-2,3-diacylglucosamine diphosphatase [Flavobacteriales bacterium]|nr:UDP-2,3-diacylglucosamine diphosphatase [Flavobacteriales bacterium]